ncbi:peptidoglycan editing factor PgeF [Acidocella sp.]|uniref:peptidoglycan editing factor PgeF n=1 Tax=Acidocella sp. TaxID=50710 RepID=UPI003D00CBFD
MTEFISSSLPARHGFFTRHGGVSAGYYASLNCSFSSDDRHNVRQNRARAASALGARPEALLGLKQVHGPKVITVTAPWDEGAGPEADAFVTTLPGLALGIITADCAPVLFAGDNGAIGAAHAGWRGALAGVLEETIRALRALGAEAIQATIGPCIHQKSYEVGHDLHDQILSESDRSIEFFTPGDPGHFHFDLPGYCMSRLARLGIAASILPHDTYAEETLFFSYRRKTLRQAPATGHQISVICS